MFMFMLRLSAGALSVSACALSVRRAQRPRAQSNRRAAARGIVHWAQRAARRSRWLEQLASGALTSLYEVIAEPKPICGVVLASVSTASI